MSGRIMPDSFSFLNERSSAKSECTTIGSLTSGIKGYQLTPTKRAERCGTIAPLVGTSWQLFLKKVAIGGRSFLWFLARDTLHESRNAWGNRKCGTLTLDNSEGWGKINNRMVAKCLIGSRPMQETMVLTMTPEAVRRLKQFMDEQGMPDAYLRVFVAPGGCSGLQYGMALEEAAEEDDLTFECEGVRVVVDPFSASYLQGAEIDYVNSLMGGGFTIHNPNAVATCACGHSFDAGGNSGTAQGCGCGGW